MADPDLKAGIKPMRLLYFTTQYPHVSHTFIRREINCLEELGYEIVRVAINPGDSATNEEDKAEERKTLHLLSKERLLFFRRLLAGMRAAKLRVAGAACEAFRFSRSSDRGLLRHIAYLLEALVLLRITKLRAVDHVHVHFATNAATVAYLCSRMGGPPFSVTVHGPVEFDQPYGQSLPTKLAAAQFIIAISSFCRSQLFRWVPPVKWQDIHIVGCSVGDEWFNASLPITEANRGFVCVGRLDEQKGQLLLVEAFADAVKAGCNEDLTIIGDGPFRRAIEELIAERGIQNRCHLAGWCDAETIRRYLLSSKGLIVASFAEGLPVVIMEAMALSRPVLATRIAGIPELVRDGTDGWLVTPGDREELTKGIMRIAETDWIYLKNVGHHAQKRVRQRHLTTDIARQLDRVFNTYRQSGSGLMNRG